MKRVKSTMLLLMALAFTNSAYAGNGYTITARVENGNTYNSLIKEVRVEGLSVSGTYANGGFTITLPGTVDAKKLEDCGNGDGKVKCFPVSGVEAYDHSGSKVGTFAMDGGSSGEFYYGGGSFASDSEVSGSQRDGSFWYVAKDSTIDIGGDDGTCVHLFLKKGWNKVYWDEYYPTGNSCVGTAAPDNSLKWHLYLGYASELKKHSAKGTLGASGKSRPIEMFFENIYGFGDTFVITGKSKTSAAKDAFGGTLKISSQTVGGSCKSDEFEIKGSYDLKEEASKTSGSFKGAFNACVKNGKFSKASFKGNWVKDANGNKTPCDFGL